MPFMEVNCNQAYTPGTIYELYKILGLLILMTVSSSSVSFDDEAISVCFHQWLIKYLLLKFDIDFFELKVNGGRGRRPIF